MKALAFGLLMIAAAVAAALPQGLNWWPDILAFLRGGLPVLAVLLGLLALLVGLADIKDRADAKKEKQTEKEIG
jgi:hypothetical protein